MKQIILDADFLVSIAKYRVDLFSELQRLCSFPFETCIFTATLDELKALQKRKDKTGQSAKIALMIIHNKIKVLKGHGRSDDLLAAQADEDHLIATLDKALKRRIPGKKIVIKQRKHLAFQD